MVVLRILLLGLICLAPVAATAAEKKKACLTPQERNAAIAARKAVPLARAMQVVKAKIPGAVVNARLCRQETAAAGSTGATKGLVYVLTVLARNGKVTQARVDAADGHWLGGS